MTAGCELFLSDCRYDGTGAAIASLVVAQSSNYLFFRCSHEVGDFLATHQAFSLEAWTDSRLLSTVYSCCTEALPKNVLHASVEGPPIG